MKAAMAFAAMLVSLAVLTALLAADVRSWSSSVASGDALYVASAPLADWTPGTRFGGAGRELLGVGDDLQLRRALRLYRASEAVSQRRGRALDVQAARADAQDALAAAARRSPPQAASQALTLLGVLTFRAVAAGGARTAASQAALSIFTRAVRADPQNDLAKYDLELLLQRAAKHGSRPRGGQRSGGGKSGRKVGHGGNGAAGPAGRGY